MSRKPAVFLDRDGTLNHVVMRDGMVSSPWAIEEFVLLEGAEDFIAQLRKLGYFVAIVTNQPDLARGWLKEKDLLEMHRRLPSDRVEFCGSGDDADRRRKPNPGMLLDLAESCALDLPRSWMVGDSRKDVLAGKAAGVRTIFLSRPYNSADRGLADFECKTYSEVIGILRA